MDQAVLSSRAATGDSAPAAGDRVLADRHMEPGQIALPSRQRGDRFDAVAIAQLDRQLGRLELLHEAPPRRSRGWHAAERGRRARTWAGRGPARLPVRRQAKRALAKDARRSVGPPRSTSRPAASMWIPRPRPHRQKDARRALRPLHLAPGMPIGQPRLRAACAMAPLSWMAAGEPASSSVDGVFGIVRDSPVRRDMDSHHPET